MFYLDIYMCIYGKVQLPLKFLHMQFLDYFFNSLILEISRYLTLHSYILNSGQMVKKNFHVYVLMVKIWKAQCKQ